MRLLRVYIDGYRNLKNVTVDFDKDSLTTVVIGENGSGKSNLIEAIVEVFRAYDLNDASRLKFNYEIDYEISRNFVKLHKKNGNKSKLYYTVKRIITSRNGSNLEEIGGGERVPWNMFPQLIFGYYSGSSRKLEMLFDRHQSIYYNTINKPEGNYERAIANRKLFYCRPIHGVLALISHFAVAGKDNDASKLLIKRLKITGFHSALAHLKEPSWFSGSKAAAKREAGNLWGAYGPAGECARALRDAAFHPLELEGSVVDDYRHKAAKEAQLACFLRDQSALNKFVSSFQVPTLNDESELEYRPPSDQELFASLEAMDISDLIREMLVWVTREDNETGDISFSDLSDGERQLLMVLGLIRVSRGKEALFLLDEPDTHLNPAWQLGYLELIRDWTDVATKNADQCQIIMTTHNPLTIAALEANEVRVMSTDDEGNVSVAPPRIDPKGLGFAGVLTDIFGLSSSLDKPTQELIDKRNRLAAKDELTPAMAKEFADIKDELRHLGFLYEERDKLYSEFLKQLDNVELADVEPLTPDELRERESETRRIVEELLEKK